jgi:hypothetical protein
MKAGKYAAQYAMGTLVSSEKTVDVTAGNNIRYVCPQKIRLSEINEKIDLYFRVSSPDKNVNLVIKVDEDTVASKKAKIINPGEMEHLTIDSEKIIGNNVKVEVEA